VSGVAGRLTASDDPTDSLHTSKKERNKSYKRTHTTHIHTHTHHTTPPHADDQNLEKHTLHTRYHYGPCKSTIAAEQMCKGAALFTVVERDLGGKIRKEQSCSVVSGQQGKKKKTRAWTAQFLLVVLDGAAGLTTLLREHLSQATRLLSASRSRSVLQRATTNSR